MAELFNTLLEMSLRGSYIILVLLIVRLLTRRAPRRFTCLLWLVAFFRLICPVSISSFFSLVPREETFAPPQILHETFFTGMTVQNTQQGYIGVSQTAISPLNILMVVWLSGAVLMVAGSLFSLWRLRRALRGAVRTADGAWEVTGLPTAFIVGIFRPRIYLPAGLPEQERKFVLCHEHAHLRRGDWIIKLVAHFILCLHWFNPLVWLAFRLLCRDMEIACDEQVVRELGKAQQGAYSRTLLHLAGGPRHSGALAFGEGDVKGRIRHLMNYKKPIAAVTAICAVVVVLLGTALLVNPSGETRPDWLVSLEPEQITRAELLHHDADRTSAVWFEEDQLEQLAKQLRAARAEMDPAGGLEPEMLNAAYPQYDQLYLLMASGEVHTILHLDDVLLIDGAPYEPKGDWSALWEREGTEEGLSEEMVRAASWGQELYARIQEKLLDSVTYDAQTGALTLTVPEEAEGQGLMLSISGQTMTGETWQGFAVQNGTQNWNAGETYSDQAKGLQTLTVSMELGGKEFSFHLPMGNGGSGYIGMSSQNSPIE